MHPNRKFHIEDRDSMAALVRELGFGILFAPTDEGLRAVHVPVLLDGDRLRFHVSRGNLVHSALAAGGEALFVATGPHAYISPEWYGLEDRVPTWNYVAVELAGPVRMLATEELVALLDELSADQEARLAPKEPWTRARMSPGRFEGLLKAITGFEMRVAQWRGTAKIDQDKPEAVRASIADALARRGEREMAEMMVSLEIPPLHLQGRGTARSAVEGPDASGEPLHQAAPEAQFIQSDAAGGVEGPGPPPREIAGRN